MVIRLALTAFRAFSCVAAASAGPSRIIILRHGEKADAQKLCGVGQGRADALARFYLGCDAAKSLLTGGEHPAAILAITLHPLELAAPVAATWEQPLTLYSVVHQRGVGENAVEMTLSPRTQETWPSGTYDYFWIVEYGNQGSDRPTSFSMVKQEFGSRYGKLPSNDWGAPNGLTSESGCDLKGASE